MTDLASWSSSLPGVATVSSAAGSKGLASTLAVGSTTITADFGGKSGQTQLTVTAATLVSIAVTPTNPSIAKGTTQPFVATGSYSDSSSADLTDQVTWSSSAPSVGAISNATGSKGQTTGLQIGQTTISASLAGRTGQTVLTVTAALLSSIAVTPTNPSIAKGTKQKLTATGTYSDATTQDLTDQASWSSWIAASCFRCSSTDSTHRQASV